MKAAWGIPDFALIPRRAPSCDCRVGSGRKFNSLGMWTAVKGWGGLEFAVGIPGTAGGAAFMNAGAHGQVAASYSIPPPLQQVMFHLPVSLAFR